VQLIAAHQTRLRGLIRCLTMNSRDVDDVLQETNRVLWQKAEDFQPGTDFWAWAARIARFEVLTWGKRRRRDRHVFDDQLIDRLGDFAQAHLQDADGRLSALEQCLERQPSANRQLLELRYVLDEPISTISRTLDRPTGSVRQTLYRIRAALADCVQRMLAREAEA